MSDMTRREIGARALFLQFVKPKAWRTKAMWKVGINDDARQQWLEQWDRVELEIRLAEAAERDLDQYAIDGLTTKPKPKPFTKAIEGDQ